MLLTENSKSSRSKSSGKKMNKVIIIDISLLLVVLCLLHDDGTGNIYDIDYLLLFIHYYSSEQNEVLHACCTCMYVICPVLFCNYLYMTVLLL